MNTRELIEKIKSSGITQHRLAKLVGCTQGAISLWATGKREAGGIYYARLLEVVNERL